MLSMDDEPRIGVEQILPGHWYVVDEDGVPLESDLAGPHDSEFEADRAVDRMRARRRFHARDYLIGEQP